MTTTPFNHWRDVPTARWRWKNFSPAEIACRGSGSLRIHDEALDKLQALRDRLGKPLIVRSAYRSPAHNRAVGGAARSKHLDGTAFDIAMTNHDPVAFEAAARAVGFKGFGFYPRSGFMHIDLGPARQWGERFLVREAAFAMETPPARVKKPCLMPPHPASVPLLSIALARCSGSRSRPESALPGRSARRRRREAPSTTGPAR